MRDARNGVWDFEKKRRQASPFPVSRSFWGPWHRGEQTHQRRARARHTGTPPAQNRWLPCCHGLRHMDASSLVRRSASAGREGWSWICTRADSPDAGTMAIGGPCVSLVRACDVAASMNCCRRRALTSRAIHGQLCTGQVVTWAECALAVGSKCRPHLRLAAMATLISP